MNPKEKEMASVFLFNLLKNDMDNETDNAEDDATFRHKTTRQISSRDSEYSKLLQHFVQITKIRNILKEFFKWSFYLAIIITGIVLTVIVYKLFNKYISSVEIEQILKSLPLSITALVGFVSTIIAIPVAITKYLFNTDED